MIESLGIWVLGCLDAWCLGLQVARRRELLAYDRNPCRQRREILHYAGVAISIPPTNIYIYIFTHVIYILYIYIYIYIYVYDNKHNNT